MSLEQYKADLLARASLEEYTDEERERLKKLAPGLRDIPVKKMMDQALYIREQLLPQIEKKSGRKDDYKFFDGVADSLLWGIMLADRYRSIELIFGNTKVSYQLMIDRVSLLERELAKYDAARDIMYTESFDHYMRAIATRAEDLLRKKG